MQTLIMAPFQTLYKSFFNNIFLSSLIPLDLRFIQTTHLRLVVSLVEYEAVDFEIVVVGHHMVRIVLDALL